MADIKLLLGNTNIDIEIGEPNYSFQYEKGLVISQNPEPGQYIFETSQIQLILSKGIPFKFNVIEEVDENYAKVSLTLDVINKNGVQNIEISEKINDNLNILYSDYHYAGDMIIKDFIINKKQNLLLKVMMKYWSKKTYLKMSSISNFEKDVLNNLIQKTKQNHSPNQFPNPNVGAVVIQNEQIISEGFHQVSGEDHAEVIALKKPEKKPGAQQY